MAAYDIKEACTWPVNELGEIVAQSGIGTSSITGNLHSDFIPVDPDTGRVAIKISREFYGSNIAILGDSIAQQNTNNISGSLNYLQRGPVIWMLSYLGWPWDTQPSDNFAVFGTTMDIILRDQIPALLAANKTRKYSRAFISSGTNDTHAGTFSLDQIKANYLAIFKALRDENIIPVHVGIRPRDVDNAGSYTGPVAAAKLQNVALNEWLYQQSLLGILEYIPIADVYADNSTAFGNVLPSLVYDGVLHPNGRGASLEGLAMANYYSARGIAPQMRFATQQNDVFDRVNNVTGVAFNAANPLLQGSVADALGVKPTGMTVFGAGSTWSKVNRTLSNGQVRSDPSCAMVASTLHYLYDDWLATSGQPWGANQVQPGDVLEARAKVVITNGVNIQNIRILASVNDGTTVTLHSGLFGDSSSIPDGTYTLYLKTPRFTLPVYSGSGQQSIYSRVECTTSAGGSGTFTVQALEIRKVA